MEIEAAYTKIKHITIKFGQTEIEDALITDAVRLNQGFIPKEFLSFAAKRELDWQESDDGVLSISIKLSISDESI